MVAVLIPVSSHLDEARGWAAHYVEGHYEHFHPSWDVWIQPIEGTWNKPAALNRAFTEARAADHDIVILADADSVVPPEDLETAVRWAQEGRAWCTPHGDVYRLTEAATRLFSAQFRSDFELAYRAKLTRPTYRGIPGGGIVVVRSEVYADVRGLDERFEGWGGEDISFGMCLKTLHGAPGRVGAPLVHLWHPPAAPHGRGSIASEKLVARYTAASGYGERMRSLVEERAPLARGS